MGVNFNLAGSATHSLDDKGRLALPSKFREELRQSEKPEEVMALASRDGSVTLYPHEQWLEIVRGIREIPEIPKRDAVSRQIISKAESLTLDKAGRILISPRQRAAAGLNREVELLGCGFKIEIWDQARLERQTALDAPYEAEFINDPNLRIQL